MTHKDAQDLLALYAMGELDPNEGDALARHLQECLSCRRDLDQYQDVLSDWDQALAEPDWSGHQELRRQFRARLDMPPETLSEAPPSAVTRRAPRPAWRWPIAWAATLLVAIGGWSVAYQNHQQWAESQRIMAFVTRGRPVAMQVVHASVAHVELYLTGSHAVVWVKQLPPLASDQVYEGWWIVNGSPRPAGTFQTGATLLAYVEGASAFAITKEPHGGTRAPTTPILVMGRL